ncbi:MAG: hypothetical protein N2512_01335, partial [Armatimonadetes bacterium]|nr:hypothetical protein [Armatimonadota bacterium]
MGRVESSIRERTAPTERIRRLREDALGRPVTGSFEIALYGGESWMQTRGELWWIVRRGRRLAHILRNMEVVIGPDDLLVGRLSGRAPTPEEAERLARANEFMAAQPAAAGQSGHMAPDVPTLLGVGCRGLQARIAELAAGLDPSAPEAAPKLAFYRAAHEALDGLCDFAGRYADKAEELAGETEDLQRREELLRIAEVCRRVPAYPARTFHEALQALHFLLFVLNCVEGCSLTSPGSIDRYLWPYLQADLAEGRLTREEAQELLDAFFVSFNSYIARGLAIGLLVGGRDAEGKDVTNELTWMSLHACDHVRLPYPSLGLRVHSGTPPELLDYALELLAEGTTQPALFNDEVVTAGLVAAGLPLEDACDYVNSTCVEITPCGKSNVWVASPYFNLPQILLDIISDIGTGEIAAPADFEALMVEYERRLGEKIGQAVAEQNTYRYSCMAHRNFPLASCFVRDCLDRGLDMEWGGARYNWIECSFVGLATAADSLEAVREFVYRRGDLDWRALHAMLARNFEGDEAWRQRLMREADKYGNDEKAVDALAQRIMQTATRECQRHRTVFGAGFHPGLFAWIMHSVFGEATGATPDGRLVGLPLSPGPDPSPGRAKRGPTATVLSATGFDHTPLIGGVALNLKFSPTTLDTPEKRRKLASLVRVYFDRGGFQVQINAVGAATLRDAQEHPERY